LAVAANLIFELMKNLLFACSLVDYFVQYKFKSGAPFTLRQFEIIKDCLALRAINV
jgi:hypothetical protein